LFENAVITPSTPLKQLSKERLRQNSDLRTNFSLCLWWRCCLQSTGSCPTTLAGMRMKASDEDVLTGWHEIITYSLKYLISCWRACSKHANSGYLCFAVTLA